MRETTTLSAVGPYINSVERDRAHQNVKLLISGCPANKVKRGNLVLMTLDSKKAPQFGGRQPWVCLWVIARG
jgi:hypothetical protein